jgi:hypothetical protein
MKHRQSCHKTADVCVNKETNARAPTEVIRRVFVVENYRMRAA